jgi:site-specific DNA-methyltransferase (adenine-specific)
MKLNKSRIILGDNLEVLSQLPDNHFQLLLADPPYEISRSNNFDSMGRAGIDFGEWDKNFDQLEWIRLALPKLKPGGSIVIWNDWKKLGLLTNFLIQELSLKPGKAIRSLIWHKPNPSPFNCKRMFVQSTEMAVWTTKPGGKSVFNSNYHHGIFEYSTHKSANHPTKKPDQLFHDIIEILTNPNDWVLDPFIGGGTTAFAAESSGRNFIGIEQDENYFKIAVEHWRRACSNLET